MSVVLYSTGCPKCRVLEKKLNTDGIRYSISNDINKLVEKGFQSVPVLDVDGDFLEFKDAVNWIKNRGKRHED